MDRHTLNEQRLSARAGEHRVRVAGIMDEYISIVTVVGLGLIIVIGFGAIYFADKWG